MPNSRPSKETSIGKRGEIWLADFNPRRGTEPGNSDALVDQVRAIDNVRLVQGPLSGLQPQQLSALEHALLDVCDLPAV